MPITATTPTEIVWFLDLEDGRLGAFESPEDALAFAAEDRTAPQVGWTTLRRAEAQSLLAAGPEVQW